MSFFPNFWTTLNGSMPHRDTAKICQHIVNTIDIPIWPQMSKLNFRENMYPQFSATLPAITLDEENEKIQFDTSVDITPALEKFYTPYLEDNVDAFAFPKSYSSGFYTMLDQLTPTSGTSGKSQTWLKGQVTGPISMGLMTTDQVLRASLYDEMLADTIVKNTAMNARWQIRQLKSARPNVIIFVDEPYMASFGSAYISLSRTQVVSMLDEVFAAIHGEGGLAGIHCCGNTDWSVLMETQVDILNIDAHGFLENLALYPVELQAFLDRGGVIAWGIVPNTEEIYDTTHKRIANRLRDGIILICEKAVGRGININPADFENRSLVTPTCGLGPTTAKIADKVLEVLAQTGKLLQNPEH